MKPSSSGARLSLDTFVTIFRRIAWLPNVTMAIMLSHGNSWELTETYAGQIWSRTHLLQPKRLVEWRLMRGSTVCACVAYGDTKSRCVLHRYIPHHKACLGEVYWCFCRPYDRTWYDVCTKGVLRTGLTGLVHSSLHGISRFNCLPNLD